MKNFLRLLITFFYRINVKISDDAADTHGIIVCNHQSFLDGVLLGLFLPQAPLFVVDRAVANRWYFKWPLKWIDHVTIDTTHPMSIKYLIAEAQKGRSIVVFPEGRITLTGSFMKFYEGSAFIAYKANVPMIPVYLEGAEFTFFSRLRGLVKRRLFSTINITVKDPIDITVPPAFFGRQRRQYLANFTHDLFMNFRVEQYTPQSLFESFLTAKRQFGSGRVIIEDLERNPLTYSQLLTRVIGASRALRNKTEKDERVGILLPNASGAVATILGLSAAQRTPAMLNYSAGIKGIEVALVAAEIKTVVSSRQFIEKARLDHLVEHFNQLNWIFLEDLQDSLSIYDKWQILKARIAPLRYLPQKDTDSEAVVLFTSGSEGKPKGVVHTHRSILTNVEQLRTVADFTTQDKFMITLPLFHAFGLTVGIFLPIISGAHAFYYPSPLHYRIIPEIIYDIRATVLFGTSTFLLNYARRGNPYDFASLRYVVAGAERLSDECRDIWAEKIGQRVLEGYGVTECAPVISINVPMNHRQGTVGKALPGVKCDLVPIDGVEKGGELVIQAGNVMAGYLLYDRPGEIETTHYDGRENWYGTGDIVSIDDEGFLTIQGRAKRFAKIAGEMVSLEVVETLMHNRYYDDHHAAVIRNDAQRGEAIVLYTTTKEFKRSDILDTARQLGISELAIPRDIRVLPEIPRLGSGKTDYVTLTQMAKEEK